ncbi:MAG: chemotaxis protein, partial [Spirochaetaceae bacterium]
NVQDGFTIIRQNLQQMDHVKTSYMQTIDGIKNLSEHISGIWEIVKIINGIAGQIKIIAFNAALEASSAGEAGKNFEIVASEIRRLADNTVASTKEIRSRIGEIEEASDKLIQFSGSDSEKIQEAWKLSQVIEDLFAKILQSSEASAESAEEIQGSVDKQVNAFEQILITLRQISEGISEFTASIDENSTTAESLNQTVQVLNNIVQRHQVSKIAGGTGGKKR